jgi:hypothetical protein
MGEFQDHYVLERRVAGQIEAEWGDVLLGDFVKAENTAARRLGLTDFLVQPTYYRAVANWLSSALAGQPNRAHTSSNLASMSTRRQCSRASTTCLILLNGRFARRPSYRSSSAWANVIAIGS